MRDLGSRGPSLGLSVPGWHRETQHVGEGASPPIGRRAREPADLRAQHDLGRHGTLDKREATAVLAPRRPLEDEAVDELAGEPHAHPATGDNRRGEVLGHQIVERPIEVRE